MCVSHDDSIALGGVFAHDKGVLNANNLTTKRPP